MRRALNSSRAEVGRGTKPDLVGVGAHAIAGELGLPSGRSGPPSALPRPEQVAVPSRSRAPGPAKLVLFTEAFSSLNRSTGTAGCCTSRPADRDVRASVSSTCAHR